MERRFATELSLVGFKEPVKPNLRAKVARETWLDTNAR